MTKKLSKSGWSIVRERLAELELNIYNDRIRIEASKILEPDRTKWIQEEPPYADGCSATTWGKFVEGKSIRARTFNAFCQVLALDPADVVHNPKTNWGQAPELETFYGREKDLTKLKEFILKARCRLISIVGFAGIGKTKLSLKLARQVEEEFEYIIWRKLYDTLPLESLLKKLIKFVSDGRRKRVSEYNRGANRTTAALLKGTTLPANF